VKSGLTKGLASGPVASIGIDVWGVDYGLIGSDGALIAAPFSHRSQRTSEWLAVAERLGAERLYRTTGIQLMGINTVFQLAVHDAGELDRADRLVMLPELMVHALTGAVLAERTSAGTTGLVDVSIGDWSAELIAEIGLDRSLFLPISQPGEMAGRWHGIPVHLVGGHDTASAVAAAPMGVEGRSVFVSSGTWMLVGAEHERAVVSNAARAMNMSNEPAVGGGVRLLKNVMGLWMFEQCCQQWQVDRASLLAAAAKVPEGGPVFDATDDRFVAPADMEVEVRAAARLSRGAGCDVVARCILDSLAAGAAVIVDELETLTGRAATDVVVVGGGVRNALLNELIARASGLDVRNGPAEASALGNALVQGIGLGVYSDLAEARLAMAEADTER
jgi:rhamnulokinase